MFKVSSPKKKKKKVFKWETEKVGNRCPETQRGTRTFKQAHVARLWEALFPRD